MYISTHKMYLQSGHILVIIIIDLDGNLEMKSIFSIVSWKGHLPTQFEATSYAPDTRWLPFRLYLG